MIQQLNSPFQFTQQDITCMANANNNWDSRSACMIDVKARMKDHFDDVQQERCCYCGLLYDRTGRGEIEHIAPKGATLYPQFTFHPNNLAAACQLCNSSSMKHMYDSIHTLSNIYENCVFNIVHPYLDDHTQHYQWRYGILNIVISANPNSLKARESIRLFKLDSEKRTRARAIERNQRRLEALYNIPLAIKDRIRAVINFR